MAMQLFPEIPRKLTTGGCLVRRRSGLLPVLCGIFALIVGCSSMAGVEPLEVTLSNLRITEVTVFETTLVAQLRITNPNPESFTINGGSYKLILDDKKIGTGTTSETFTVQRLDSAVVDAVFHLNNASALLRLKNILQEKNVSYGVSGSLFTEGTFGTRKLKIEKTGRLDLSDSSPTAIEGPGIGGPEPQG
jgi:LEA14-like dessication related protein